MTELKGRGVKDNLIACVDGLKGLPEAIGSAFLKAEVQLCIVHQIRNSMRFVASKFQKEFIQDLKPVYKSETREQGEAALVYLEDKWGSRYPMAVKGWRTHWAHQSTI
jgi:putative transposase